MVADNKDRCGIGLFSTGDNDPFKLACDWHDRAYTAKEVEKSILSRKQVDEQFLRQMLLLAGDSKRLRLRAKLYYYAARLLGGGLWNF